VYVDDSSAVIKMQNLSDAETGANPITLVAAAQDTTNSGAHISDDEQYFIYTHFDQSDPNASGIFLQGTSANMAPFQVVPTLASLTIEGTATPIFVASPYSAAIDGDGHSIVFAAEYSLPSEGNSTLYTDIFRYDWTTDPTAGTYSIVSHSAPGEDSVSADDNPFISADGNTVVWTHYADHTDPSSSQIDILHNGNPESVPSPNEVAPSAFALSADGHFVAFGDGDGLWVYDTDTDTGAPVQESSDSVTALSMTADGHFIAYSDGNSVNVVDMFDGNPAGSHDTVTISNAGSDPSFSADGHFLTYTDGVSGGIDVVDFAPVNGTQGNDLLVGNPNSPVNTFIGHGGNDVAIATAVEDTFVFLPNDQGNSTIVGFDTAHDFIDVTALGITDALDIASIVNQDPANSTNTVVDLTPELHVTLQNVNYLNVTAQNFIVGHVPSVMGG
jgi:hypothetical protein